MLFGFRLFHLLLRGLGLEDQGVAGVGVIGEVDEAFERAFRFLEVGEPLIVLASIW